jgi:hypothetical protein
MYKVQENSLSQKEHSYVFVAKPIIEKDFVNRQTTQVMWAVLTKFKSQVYI